MRRTPSVSSSSEGDFYGTAGGGVNGEGRVFELNPTTWLETIVHDFYP